MSQPESLEQHDELVRLAERRVLRASEKRAGAITEEADAIRALQDACTARADWIAANSDPQLAMF